MSSPTQVLHEWLAYFENNQNNRLEMERFSSKLSSDERARIGDSIADFQLGEAGEGSFYKVHSRRFSKLNQLPEYDQLTKLFIAEENRHSAYLLYFMKRHGIAKKEKETTDFIFKKSRKLLNLEWFIRVLLTAEVIAQVYYPSLEHATKSQLLQLITRRILQEEQMHTLFQMQMLTVFNQSTPYPIQFIKDGIHLLCIWATALVVWFRHYPVLSIRLNFILYFAEVTYIFLRDIRQSSVLKLPQLHGTKNSYKIH